MCNCDIFQSASNEKQWSRAGYVARTVIGNKKAFGVHRTSMERRKPGIIGM